MSKIVVGQQFPDLAIDTLYGGKKHISDLLCEKKDRSLVFTLYRLHCVPL